MKFLISWFLQDLERALRKYLEEFYFKEAYGQKQMKSQHLPTYQTRRLLCLES